MKTNGLRSDYLNKLANLCLQPEKFKGVYPCNHFADLFLKPGHMAIVNLSHSKNKGSHYVSVMTTKKHVYYMDPYGTSCDDKFIMKALKKTKKPIKFLSVPIQPIDSLFCGFFCLCFLIIGSKNTKPLRAIKKKFSSIDVHQNEKTAVYIIKQSIKNNSVLKKP